MPGPHPDIERQPHHARARQGGANTKGTCGMKMMRMVPAVILASLLVATGAAAQDAAAGDTPGAAVVIELNTVKPNEAGCTLTFMVTNEHPRPIEKAVYETVLFDSAGQVDRLTLFDFGTLPAGRPRVRQFSVSGIACGELSRLLINGAHTCAAPDLADGACTAGLTLRTRTEIEVIG